MFRGDFIYPCLQLIVELHHHHLSDLFCLCLIAKLFNMTVLMFINREVFLNKYTVVLGTRPLRSEIIEITEIPLLVDCR